MRTASQWASVTVSSLPHLPPAQCRATDPALHSRVDLAGKGPTENDQMWPVACFPMNVNFFLNYFKWLENIINDNI